MPHSHSHSSGFSLIEVLVAFSVLALGIAGSAKLGELGFQQLSATRNYQQAAFLAHTHLTTLDKVQSYAALGAAYQTGSYNDRFNWELSLTTIRQDSQPEPPAFTTTRVIPVNAILNVRFEDDARSLQFQSLILAPAVHSTASTPEHRPTKLSDTEELIE